jgi:spore coat polysaccharide biosynthesis predicted glycosyltransferase SpsG
MRARTLAQSLRFAADTKMAVIGDEVARSVFREAERASTYFVDEADVPSLCEQFRPDALVFDTTRFAEEPLARAAAGRATVSLSPVFDRLSSMDVVFHRTSVRGPDWPQGPRPEVRAGLQYAIVSGHCRTIAEEVYLRHLEQDMLSVAISMGGTDAANKTLRVLDAVNRVPERMLLWVLLGEGYAHSYEELVAHNRGSGHEIIMAKTNESMWRILGSCSLAVLAGGTTTYEAAFAGLPSVNLLERPSNYFLIQELVEKRAAICAGSQFEEGLPALEPLLRRLLSNRRELLAMHHKSKGLIDGLGAQRIAEEIVQLARKRQA